MVRRIMEHVVADIAEHQSSKHAGRKPTEDYQEDAVKKKCERHTDTRRHNKPFSIVWIIVMHAVNDIVEPFSQARFRFVMENVSMDQIFEQRPEQYTEQEKSHDNKH